MAEYEGSNDSSTMEGNTKEVYVDKVAKLVPGTGKKRFRKIKKVCGCKDE